MINRPKIITKNIIINDTEYKARKLPRVFNARVIRPFEIRKRMFKQLNELVKDGKFDLILTVDSGGTWTFLTPKLMKYGNKVASLPFSVHITTRSNPSTEHINKYENILEKNLSKIQKQNPRILILDSDAGSGGWSINKMIDLHSRIKEKFKDADVKVGIGAVSKQGLSVCNKQIHDFKPDLIYSFETQGHVNRLSEIDEIYVQLSREDFAKVGKKKLDELVRKYKRKGQKEYMTSHPPYI